MIFYTDNNQSAEETISAFAKDNGISKLLTKLLFQRGIDTAQKLQTYFNPSLEQLEDPFNLKGMKECVDRIKLAIQNQQKVLLYGDYDVDGISATTVLYKFFQSNGIIPNYFLPNRYEDGYGLTMDTAKHVVEEYKPDLIITVDCGISCYQEVAYLKSCGIDVIVTDHHEIPEILPDCIVIDPKMEGQAFSFNGLCGTGVAMKVVQAILGKEQLDAYLPIVAIATVADIVPLQKENRAIVKLGLSRLDLLPMGAKMLLKDLDKADGLDSSDIAFRLAPKLNAAGRMGDATIALRIFISDDKQEIETLLQKLTEMNTKRQELCATVYNDCIQILSEQKDENNRAIILKKDGWDSGLLGIACARLADEFNKPTFLFSEIDGKLRGSARSVGTINIHKVLSSCKDLLMTFGGHSMAAGMTLNESDFLAFKARILDDLNTHYSEDEFIRRKYYDQEILPEELTVKFVSELNLMEPFGCDNARPVFKLDFLKCEVEALKNYPQHITVQLPHKFKMIAFNSAEETLKLNNCFKKSALVELQLNEFKNHLSVKGIIKQLNYEGYNQGLDDFATGLYIKQLAYETTAKNGVKVVQFDERSLSQVIETNLNASNFGTLIVLHSMATYNRISHTLKSKPLNYFVSRIDTITSENSVTLGLDYFSNLKLFDKIILTESVLSVAFLNQFQNCTIYVPTTKKKNVSLNLNRSELANFYLAIKDSMPKIIAEQNEWNYYQAFKRLNPNFKKLTYTSFVAYLYTFVDLKLIEIINDTKYQLSLKSTEKTQLNNSKFYNDLFALASK